MFGLALCGKCTPPLPRRSEVCHILKTSYIKPQRPCQLIIYQHLGCEKNENLIPTDEIKRGLFKVVLNRKRFFKRSCEVSTNHNMFRKSSASHVLMFILILNSAIPGTSSWARYLSNKPLFWPRIKGGNTNVHSVRSLGLYRHFQTPIWYYHPCDLWSPDIIRTHQIVQYSQMSAWLGIYDWKSRFYLLNIHRFSI